MRLGVLVCVLLGLASARSARAAPATPIRISIQCDEPGRTKACPAFLLGFVDTHKVLLAAPRATAEVILYVTASQIALVDRLQLRFVSTIKGAPSELELEVDIDTRATDDTQRAQLEPAFLRGLVLAVATRYPAAVTVAFATPVGVDLTEPDTSPYGFAFSVGGSGSRTGRYQTLNAYAEVAFSRITRTLRLDATASANGGLNRQPALVTDDGTVVPLDNEQWNLHGGGKGAWLYSRCLSFGGAFGIGRDDPKGQYRHVSDVNVGVEWDRYAADDPRGNRLAILYAVGYKAEGYNIRNELGERFAHYPIHKLVASGTVRRDKVSFGLSLSAGGELLKPTRRHDLSASPYVEIQIGDRIDLSFSFSITKRELPAPDESLIDPSDFQQLSRLSYAEPLSMNGSLDITIHWDRTNGARNDRFSDI